VKRNGQRERLPNHRSLAISFAPVAQLDRAQGSYPVDARSSRTGGPIYCPANSLQLPTGQRFAQPKPYEPCNSIIGILAVDLKEIRSDLPQLPDRLPQRPQLRLARRELCSGRTYQGPWQSAPPGHVGFEPPVVIWIPAIAVSGMTFYTGDRFPKWKGDVFVGFLRTGEIPGTGHLERILFNENMGELRRESLLTELRQRIRDVRQGPDGLLYLLTDEKEGAVLRVEPEN
jgi:hypothetical protein